MSRMKGRTGGGTRGVAFVAAAATVMALAWGGAPSHASTTEPDSGDDASEALQQLYEAAQTEGSLMVYSTQVEAQIQQVIERFTEKYPGIDVEYVRLSAAELIQRFTSEEEAGVHSADVGAFPDSVFISTAVDDGVTVALSAAEIPGGFPPVGFPEEAVIGDGVSASFTISPFSIGYNTELVAPEDVPSSFEDLTDPRWAGEMVGLNPAMTSPSVYGFWNELATFYGDDYLAAIGAQDVDWSQLPLPGIQALGAGEFSIVIPAVPTLVAAMIAEGAPVDYVIPDDTTGVANYYTLSANAPHPNAARLFLHYSYSQEGADQMAADSVADVSPWGGGGRPLPAGYVVPDLASANTPERIAEIDELLAL